MAKFYGPVGYVITNERRPGVYVEEPVEYAYVGDFIKVVSSWRNASGINDDISLHNRVSIVADSFAYEHFSQLRYVVINDVAWKVTQIEVSTPRLILTIGGVYNGERPTPTP